MNGQLSYLACPTCLSSFHVSLERDNAFILECLCRKIPLIENIFFANVEPAKIPEIELLLKQGRNAHALLIASGIPKKWFYPIQLMNYFQKNNPSKRPNLFSKTIKLQRILGYDKAWSKYLLNRTQLPSFKIVQLLTKSKLENKISIDLGCGVGHTLNELENKNPKIAIGIDNSTQNLLLARYFVVDKTTLLICQNIDQPIFLKPHSVDLIFMHDTFQYSKSHQQCIKNIARIGNDHSAIYISQNHRFKSKNINGIDPEAAKEYLYKVGYKNVQIHTHASLLLGENVPNLLQTDPYTIIASKKNTIKPARTKKFNTKSVQMDELLRSQINLTKIISKYSEWVFLSPHLDDALLSCGNLIQIGKSNQVKITIISIFTNATPPPYSPQAIKHLRDSQYDNAVKFMKARRSEDQDACKKLGVTYQHLGYIDACWRKTNSGDFMYRNETIQFSGRINALENAMIAQIQTDLEKITPKKSLIFAPVGIGLHADHIIISSVAKKLPHSTLWWRDFPYSLSSVHQKRSKKIAQNMKSAIKILPFKESKKDLALHKYASQYNSLFDRKPAPEYTEEIFINLLKKEHSPSLVLND